MQLEIDDLRTSKSVAWLPRSLHFYCATAGLHRAFTVIESILNLWPISLLLPAPFPARARPRAAEVQILYSPSLEMVNEKPRFVEVWVWRELALFV